VRGSGGEWARWTVWTVGYCPVIPPGFRGHLPTLPAYPQLCTSVVNSACKLNVVHYWVYVERVKFWILSIAVLWPSPAFSQPVPARITLDYVEKKALERAARPFHFPKGDLPEALRGNALDYDSYREIEFRHDKALWLKEELPFRIEFFHPGYLYQFPVKMNEFTSTHVQPVRFVQDFFNYRKLNFKKKIPADAGYAGFKILYPLNASNRWDEAGSFLGASYFRLLGKGHHYGQSARGLTLNAGETDRTEEFPAFTDWWLGKPEKETGILHLFALLDSVSCAGAYAFAVRPGETTIADIEGTVYLREPKNIQPAPSSQNPVKTLGIAPLSSMFWFGENSESNPDDYRPEVHDSDGLLIRAENDEILWRPLKNPPSLRHQIFPASNVHGFGLLQRDRDFANYQDIFNSYHAVPSVWIEPRGKWGEGKIHLVELPTHYEGLDNIVAFWDPATKPQPMQPFRFAYTLLWASQPDSSFSTNRVLQTRIGGDPRDASKRQFVIDFEAKNSGLGTNQPPRAVVSCGENALISDTQVFKNLLSESWRVIFSLKPKAGNNDSVDIQCALKRGDQPLSETWVYQWNPPAKRRASE
jgi:glucans biosynthesis protein